MDLHTVDSEMVHAAGYDDAEGELEVVFTNGRTYRYKQVPRRIYQELMKADSKGQYMRANVMGTYDYYTLYRWTKLKREKAEKEADHGKLHKATRRRAS
jgi:KTSC domain-containing protein